jgi:hypothetical protein
VLQRRIHLVKSLVVTPVAGWGFDKLDPALWLAFYRGRGESGPVVVFASVFVPGLLFS